jgi:hypothetical protein
MNKEQQDILNEVYRKYADSHWTPPSNPKGKLLSDQLFSVVPMEHSKESFINKCKTNTEFSEKWGLKIEQRELSRQERSDYYYKYGNSEGIVEGSLDLPIWVNDETAYKWYDKRNVPTKLITITYNEKTIESYE